MNNNIFNRLNISPTEYSYIMDLSPIEKLQYLFEIYDIELNKQNSLNLHEFFNEINETADVDINDSNDEIDLNSNRSEVLLDNKHVIIQSNSLRVTRFLVSNLFESGFILQRNLVTEKRFRKHKLTRYIRVYNIVNISSQLISFN